MWDLNSSTNLMIPSLRQALARNLRTARTTSQSPKSQKSMTTRKHLFWSTHQSNCLLLLSLIILKNILLLLWTNVWSMAILRKIIPIDVVSKIISEQRMQHRSINEILPLSQIVYVIGKKLLKNDSSSAILKAKQFQLNRAVESQHL